MVLSVDVIRTVLAQLRADEQLGTLLAVGLTSKAICCHALDALWLKMTTLTPLLRCLPSDVWAMDESREWRLLRPPWRPADWTRVQSYAARVQEIYISEQGLPGLDILPHIRIHLPRDTPIFPKLRILYWKGTSSPDLFYYSPLLLGPTITDCSLESHVHGVVSTLHEMTRLCPGIKRLYISTSSVDVSVIVSTYPNLTSFKFFTTLPLAPISEPGIRCLGLLQNLTEWITNSPLEGESLRNVTRKELGAYFPALRTLNLRGPNLQAVTKLLQRMSSRQLRKFTYTFAREQKMTPSKDIVTAFIDAVAAHTQLNDFFFSSADYGMHAPFAALEGLTSLPIQRIYLQNIVSNDALNNSSIEWLTQGWTDLEWFYCCNNDTPVVRSNGVILPTPEIFCHFARKCARLVHLYLTIDTTHIPVRTAPLPYSTQPLYFHPHASLLSQRGNLWQMLEYVTEIYPRLALRLSDDIAFSDPNTVEILDELNGCIPGIVKRRAEEKAEHASRLHANAGGSQERSGRRVPWAKVRSFTY